MSLIVGVAAAQKHFGMKQNKALNEKIVSASNA